MRACWAVLVLAAALAAAADALVVHKAYTKACQYGTVGGSVLGQSCSEDACVRFAAWFAGEGVCARVDWIARTCESLRLTVTSSSCFSSVHDRHGMRQLHVPRRPRDLRQEGAVAPGLQVPWRQALSPGRHADGTSVGMQCRRFNATEWPPNRNQSRPKP